MYENKLCLHLVCIHCIVIIVNIIKDGIEGIKKIPSFPGKNVVSSITVVKDVAKAKYYKK